MNPKTKNTPNETTNPAEMRRARAAQIDGQQPATGNADRNDGIVSPGAAAPDPSGDIPKRNKEPLELSTEKTVPLREEKVKIGKREVEAGGVRIRKIVRTETINQPVELRHEELVVERVPPEEISCTGGELTRPIGEEDIFVPLRREEIVIEKEMQVREGVRIGRKSSSDKQDVTEQVRSEEVEVDPEPPKQQTP